MSSEQTQTKKRISVFKTFASNFKLKGKQRASDSFFICLFVLLTSFGVFFGSNTPFCFPLMGCVMFNERKYIKYLPLGIIGVALNSGFEGVARWALVFSFMLFITSLKGRVFTPTSAAVCCGVITGISGVAVSLMLSMGLISTITMAAEGVISSCFFYVFSVFINIVFSRKQKTVFTQNDFICMGLALSCMTCGLSQLYFFRANVAFIAAAFTILALGKIFGASCSLSYAVLTASLLVLTAGLDTAMISVFCISAVLSSVLSSLGMAACAASFCVSMGLGTLMLSGTSRVLINFYASAVGALLYAGFFMFVKYRGIDAREEEYESSVVSSESVSLIKEEIDTQKRMLCEIASYLTESPAKTDGAVTYICKVITGDVCYDCSRYGTCWGEQSSETYSDMASVINKALDSSSSELYFPKRLYSKCKNADLIPDIIPYIYDSYTAKQSCAVQLDSYRRLMRVRFEHMAGVLDRLYSKLSKGIYTYKAEAKQALSAMQNFGLGVSDAVILQDFNNKLKAIVKSNDILNEKDAKRTLPIILSKMLSRSFVFDSVKDIEGLTYCYREESRFKLTVGAAGCSKHEGAPSGDNFSNVIFPSGLQMIALCDGMGSGEAANRQSAKVLSLIEELMSAGCDETKSIETVNSVLVLCEAEESFSTIDLFLFDLQKGIGEFVKAGASPSYIKSADNISKISFDSMPVGILDYVNIRKGLKSVKSGDYIFMMSDGFFRVFGEDDEYVKERLSAYEGRNPQKIADGLLSEALCVSDGKAPDDITIIVAKVRQTEFR